MMRPATLPFHEREFITLLSPTVEEVQVVIPHGGRLTMSAGQLLTIATDGSTTVGDFTPDTAADQRAAVS